MAQAVRLGNLAGSIVVGKPGMASATQEEILEILDPARSPRKQRTLAQLTAEITNLRAAGKKIVFANGCFDLFHLGHIKFIERARQLGGTLIVAINSDRSVRAVKGKSRPVLNQQERAAILSSLDAVDYVVVFDELTPEHLLEELKPDILVKGKSMEFDDVVGAKIVESHGGRIEILPLFGEMTTDSMIERIASQATEN